ncbi:undecaprenyl-diphosphate phosphatase [Yunchengibacter salinarum]|uniref:undecaprenyl-diphosphate phosphatase n=1 Tax=Yunchengibacter salinarum TaxID=3133399 RepID=UPI0035B5E9B1
MTAIHLFLVALIQGLTEFLPISSSAHLILIPMATGLPDQGPLIDVAAHMGTLAAVLLYFRRDTAGLALAALATAGLPPARRAIQGTLYRKLFWALVVATLPVIIIGGWLAMTDWLSLVRSAWVIGVASILFGLLLWAADHTGARNRALDRMAIKPALLVGLAQIFALIPGASRAGVTMTAALALGFDRQEAARFSMLLSIPTILGAGVMAASRIGPGLSAAAWADAAVVAGLSFMAALAAIHLFLRWLAHAGMTPFVIYRLVLGGGLVALSLSA